MASCDSDNTSGINSYEGADVIVSHRDQNPWDHPHMNETQDMETWDDAFVFEPQQSFEQIFEQLRRHLPRSPLSDVSDQSDYFQQQPASTSSTSQAPSSSSISPIRSRRRSGSQSKALQYTHALPCPPTTTTATTLPSSNGTQAILSSGVGNGSSIKHLVGSAETQLKADTRNKSALPPLAPSALRSARIGDKSQHTSLRASIPTTTPPCSVLLTLPSSPTSSASSSLKIVTPSVAAPSTSAASTRSQPNTDVQNYKDKENGKEINEGEAPTIAITTMTTITQEMMLSSLPYTGIITRINPIKRVADWVDDLEDLEVPEEDLDFNQVRSSLAKSYGAPDTLESVESWDTDSEHSDARTDGLLHQNVTQLRAVGAYSSTAASLAPFIPTSPPTASMHPISLRTTTIPASETIETLDDDFDLPEDFGSFRLNIQARHHPHQDQHVSSAGINTISRKQSSLLQWQDTSSDQDDSDFETPLDNHSLSSSVSFSRDIVVDDENLLDGLIFPESMENLRLVTRLPYRPEMEPSIFGKESRFQEDQEDFWVGLDVEDDNAFSREGRNKNLKVRPVLTGRERSGSRVQRQVVPLKDFVALPSKIPRLCRAPGDTSRPVTPAPSLSRTHSTHFDLPLRVLKSKSSLPRLKRSSISRREGARAASALSSMDCVIAASEANSICSTSFVSRVPTPTSMQFNGGKRNSAQPNNKDDFPSVRPSSLAMRTVSFSEPSDMTEPALQPSVSAATSSATKSFPTLRMLVRKLDLGRPRLAARDLFPAFPSAAAVSEPESSTYGKAQVSEFSLSQSTVEAGAVAARRPSLSRSSSSSISWGSALATEATKGSRPSSKAGFASLGDISEVPTTDLNGDMDMATLEASEKYLPQLFLKLSPKYSTFGDGSELDRFDILPTFGMSDMTSSNEDTKETTHTLMQVQSKRESADRVAMWLRKPQSIVNLRENTSKPAEDSETTTASIVRRSKSIRKSLFDIFGGQSTAASAPAVVSEPVKKKKKKSTAIALIRNPSQQPKVRRVSGMVYNPHDKMWDGNDDILDEFEDEDQEVAATTMASPKFDISSPSLAHVCFPTSPLMGTASITGAVSRPALISNMNQNAKQRAQVTGKMVFDPARMCWMVSPEYLARRRQQRRHSGNHARQKSMDEAWGDEPDVFAGLSDDDNDMSHDIEENGEAVDEDEAGAEDRAWEQERDHEGSLTNGSNNNSLNRRPSQSRRLSSRPSFQRYSSNNGSVTEEERLQAWAETMKPPLNESADSRPPSTMTGTVHTIIPKSSRRSLNGAHHGSYSNGLMGGGYSSRGEFEVGIEFDITDEFLDQCMAAEAQHRKEAGRFFALPCSPIGILDPPAGAAIPGRIAKMTPAKMLSWGKKSDVRLKANPKYQDKEKASIRDTQQEGSDSMDNMDKDLQRKRKENALPLASSPLLSWPPRSRFKTGTKLTLAQLMTGYGESSSSGDDKQNGSIVSVEPNLDASEMQILPLPDQKRTDKADEGDANSASESSSNSSSHIISTHSKNKNKNKHKSKCGKSKSLSKSSFFPFVSTSSAAPAAATLAARGRGGSQDVFFHRPPARHDDSVRGSLSFAATLAITRHGPGGLSSSTSYDRRRLARNTFDSPNLFQDIDGNLSPDDVTETNNKVGKNRPRDSRLDDRDEEEFMERGYRGMSSSRGRPPLLSRTELLFEFERHTTGLRYR
ncbi:hypothetical protein BGZ50_006381 [Haplosporangium sp. Z 11]|nr:hypothetical protein BGZ50_006381 [Haplosporangium sp. Z 11]